MKTLILLLVTFLLAAPALAQQKPPLEVTADKSLEWHRDKKIYIARENAHAKQGNTELRADTLTASYTESSEGGATDISRIDAEGNVFMQSDGSTVTGDRGYYDLKKGYSEVTGDNLMLKTPTDTVTARDKLTYSSLKNELNAYGDAKAVRGDDVITSDRLIGRFVKDASGNTKMRELEAVGNVMITTPTETLRGERGVYDAAANKATITGNVRIDRGESFITGTRGEVDLDTNISRMYGGGKGPDGTGDGRVRGVFYPE